MQTRLPFIFKTYRETKDGHLILTGRIVDEGDINGDWFSYEEYKRSLPFWARMPVTIEHEEDEKDPKNLSNISSGRILWSFGNDKKREVLSTFIVFKGSQAKEYIVRYGVTGLSVGFRVAKDSKGNEFIIPEHLSIVKTPARPTARILASKQKNKNEEFLMNEEELKALATEVKELDARVKNLSEEEYASMLSMTENADPVEGSDEGKEGNEGSIEERLAKLEEALLRKDEQLANKEKELVTARKQIATARKNQARASLLGDPTKGQAQGFLPRRTGVK